MCGCPVCYRFPFTVLLLKIDTPDKHLKNFYHHTKIYNFTCAMSYYIRNVADSISATNVTFAA